MGWVALALSAQAALEVPENDALSNDNPYTAIVRRNIFDLGAAATITNTPTPAAPSSNIKLTGIFTVLGQKQALLIVNEPVASGKPAVNHSLILSEGQRSGDLEMVEINPQARTVEIKNGEIESVIGFDVTSAKK